MAVSSRSFRAARDGTIQDLPTWEVTWVKRNGTRQRTMSDHMTSEKAALNYCEMLIKNPDNMFVRAVRIEPYVVQIFPILEPSEEMSKEELITEINHLKVLNTEQGRHIQQHLQQDWNGDPGEIKTKRVE